VAISEVSFILLAGLDSKGDTGVLSDLASGELPVGVVGVSPVLDRDLRVLTVFGAKRQRAHPDAPSVTGFGVPKITQRPNRVFVPRQEEA
jgi:tripartite-type tricarboxylate transporter receptor subunit TctC